MTVKSVGFVAKLVRAKVDSAPPPPAAPAAKAPAPRGWGPSSKSSLGTLGLQGGKGTPTPAQVAGQTYQRHGIEQHDLSSRADIGKLISRSPQLDNLKGTKGDSMRCGAAAVFNAMLLDGNFAANAKALETYASQKVKLSGAEVTALAAMKSGRLTPNQAATLQDLTYRAANKDKVAGLDGIELTGLVGGLQSAGALPNTTSANFRMTSYPDGSAHWTVTSTTRGGGTAHADSWPQANGYASVTAGPGKTGFTEGGKFDPSFAGDVTLSKDLAGTHLNVRTTDPETHQVTQWNMGPHPTGFRLLATHHFQPTGKQID